MTDNIENHMVLNAPDAPWNQPDADEPTPEEKRETEARERRELKAAEYADGLRQLADFIEEHPNVPLLHNKLFAFIYDREQFVSGVKELARGGKVTKTVEKDELGDYKAVRQFGPVAVELRIPRKIICRLVSPAVYDCPDSLFEEAAEYTKG